MCFVIFPVEPRVITLLAHCRELQPTRRISITSLQKRYSVNYSKNDEKITYSSSYTDLVPGTTQDTDGSSYHGPITRAVSDSVVFKESHSDNSTKQNSAITVDLHRSHSTPTHVALHNLAAEAEEAVVNEETPLEIKISASAQKRRTSLHVQPESLKPVIMEDIDKEEELAIMESKEFSKGM